MLPGDSWLPQTLEWWQQIWASPMASAWLDADVPALVRLAILTDKLLCGEVTRDVLGEVRQIEDRFGLNPKARRALQWEIAQGEQGESVAPTPIRPVRRLRAV